MEWSSLVLFFVALGGAFQSFRLRKYDSESKFVGYSIALLVLAITQLTIVLDEGIADVTLYSDAIAEWGHIVMLSFILSSLTIFIRHSRPDFAQFPRVYALLPFLIVFSYFLVYDTFTIKQWLISIYQAGGILVALLMYSSYTYKKGREYITVLGGVSIFLITYVLYWFVPGIDDEHQWIWKFMSATGIFIFFFGYKQIVDKYQEGMSSTEISEQQIVL